MADIRQLLETHDAQIRSLAEKLERLELQSPEQRDRAEWVKNYLKTNGYLTWSSVKDIPEFFRLFKNNTTFHRSMAKMMDAIPWIRMTSKGGDDDIYYFREDFDIKSVLLLKRWRNRKPDDPGFLEYIVKEIIFKKKSVNLLDWLRETYPQRSQHWCDQVEDETAMFIRNRGYKVARNGDVFEVVL